MDQNRLLRLARDELELSNQSKIAFLGYLCHELRNPLHAISASLSMLAEETPSLLSSGAKCTGVMPATTQQESYQIIAHSAAAMLAVVNDSLDMNKIEAGKFDLESIPFSLHDIVRAVANVHRAAAAVKEIVIRVEVKPDVPNFVLGDPLRVRQILTNFVSNALKFSARGRSITLSASCVDTLSSTSDPATMVSTDHKQSMSPNAVASMSVSKTSTAPSFVELACIDNADGIPDDVLGRLFAPYTQGSSATSRLHGGTGLGLTIAKRLAVLMGGCVYATSRIGVGSTFACRLPFSPASPRNSKREGLASWHALKVSPAPVHELFGYTTDVKQPQRSTPRQEHRLLSISPSPCPTIIPAQKSLVLVVDDDTINQRILSRMLTSSGYRVILASNGQEAIDKVCSDEGKNIAVVLMDMMMPVMDGLAATRRLQQLGCKIPILAVTANVLMDDQSQYLQAGITAMLSKPFDKAEVLRALSRLSATAGRSELPGASVPATTCKAVVTHSDHKSVTSSSLVQCPMTGKTVADGLQRCPFSANTPAGKTETMITPKVEHVITENESEQIVWDTWDTVKRVYSGRMPSSFYERLFKIDATIPALFRGTDLLEQGEKMVRMFEVVLGSRQPMSALRPILRRMGDRHAVLGVTPAHFASMRTALLSTIQVGLGSAYTKEVAAAWSSWYSALSAEMILSIGSPFEHLSVPSLPIVPRA